VCFKAELDEAAAALNAAHRLSEQLDRKEAMISALRDEGTNYVVCNLRSCAFTLYYIH